MGRRVCLKVFSLSLSRFLGHDVYSTQRTPTCVPYEYVSSRGAHSSEDSSSLEVEPRYYELCRCITHARRTHTHESHVYICGHIWLSNSRGLVVPSTCPYHTSKPVRFLQRSAACARRAVLRLRREPAGCWRVCAARWHHYQRCAALHLTALLAPPTYRISSEPWRGCAGVSPAAPPLPRLRRDRSPRATPPQLGSL